MILAVLALGTTAATVTVQHRNAAEREARREAQRAAERRAAAKAEREQAACIEATDSAMDALIEIDARLDVGMNYGEFSDAAGDASVEVQQIGPGLSSSCLDAIGYMEDATAAYGHSAGLWDDCIWDYSCDMDFGDPTYDEIQSDWANAHDAIESAKAALEGVTEGAGQL